MKTIRTTDEDSVVVLLHRPHTDHTTNRRKSKCF